MPVTISGWMVGWPRDGGVGGNCSMPGTVCLVTSHLREAKPLKGLFRARLVQSSV